MTRKRRKAKGKSRGKLDKKTEKQIQGNDLKNWKM
jgi:hypothetical protein